MPPDLTPRDILTGPFCPPIAGTWAPENGVRLPTEAECGPMGRRPYDHASAMRARWCEMNGIPTGVAIPVAVADLIDRAYGLRGQPEEAALWEQARVLLVRAQYAMEEPEDGMHVCRRCGEMVDIDGSDGCRDPLCAASELRGLGDEMMGSLGLSPIRDERQAPLPMRGVH